MSDLRAVLTRVIPVLEEWMARKSYDQYRDRLWRAMVRLFNGGRGATFDGSFARSIDQQLTVAWNEGADDVGVAPDEMTREDMDILDGIIRNENDFINRIAGEIQVDAAAGMTREDFDRQYGNRADLWANRWNETVNRARIVFGGKKKLQWKLGATEKHCQTCNSLNGIVAYATEWDEARFQPQAPPNPLLECEGWRCGCTLMPTTARRTARALDRLLTIATASHL